MTAYGVGSQGAAKVPGIARSIPVPQWLTWVGGSALALGLLLALAAMASV